MTGRRREGGGGGGIECIRIDVRRFLINDLMANRLAAGTRKTLAETPKSRVCRKHKNNNFVVVVVSCRGGRGARGGGGRDVAGGGPRVF